MLRAEKGYIVVGQETDGTVTPDDLGLDWTIGRAKRDFVGKRSLSRPDMLRPDRKQLVGLLTSTRSVSRKARNCRRCSGGHRWGMSPPLIGAKPCRRSIALALLVRWAGADRARR